MKNTRGGENILLTSLPPFCCQRRSASSARRAEGRREYAVFLSPSPLRSKVSCVIKQRGRNISSVQRRPYCIHREVAGDDGVTEGLLPHANRSAEGCYRRRWKGEETGMRGGGGGGGGRNGQQDGQEDAVSGTEDGGWTGDMKGEEDNDMPGQSARGATTTSTLPCRGKQGRGEEEKSRRV